MGSLPPSDIDTYFEGGTVSLLFDYCNQDVTADYIFFGLHLLRHGILKLLITKNKHESFLYNTISVFYLFIYFFM